MINFNGTIVDSEYKLSNKNRSFLFGDGVFETIKVVNRRLLFMEDHYFRLMATMRIVRMEIPMNFTLEYIESQILLLADTLQIADSARVRFTVFRNQGGFYAPETNAVGFVIHASKLEQKEYFLSTAFYEVDLYKDNFQSKQLLSTLKTTSKIMHVTASIYAKENELDSCLLLNEVKNVVEGISGNLFMLQANRFITPPLSEGCLNGIMRKQICSMQTFFPEIEFVEEVISPFDLQKADELLLTNVISGIQPISKYRKKEYKNNFAAQLISKLNDSIIFN